VRAMPALWRTAPARPCRKIYDSSPTAATSFQNLEEILAAIFRRSAVPTDTIELLPIASWCISKLSFPTC
jgi:hypothetical protein